MDKLFESAFMKKLQDFGQKLGSNVFLASLQAAMMSLMGIIMVGAIFQILVSVLGPNMFNLFTADSAIATLLNLPYQFTMNLLSLWVVLFFAYNYSKNLKLSAPLMRAVDAVVCFLVIAGLLVVSETGTVSIEMGYLGASGMFVGFVTVFLSVHIEKFCDDHDIRIKMPDVVPPFLQDGFSAIIPLLFSVIFFLGVNGIVAFASNGALNVCSGFMMIVSAPLGALTSIPGMFVLGTFAALLWCFGIHGTMIVGTILTPVVLQSIADNGAAHAAGEPLVFYPVLLWGAVAACGGTGNTLALAILGTRSKSKQISAISKVSVGPGWFGINEPLTFGMPIMYNPILCIPYVLTVPVIMILMLIGYRTGFLQPSWIVVMALLPMGFSSYLSTLRWQNALWDYLMLIPTLIIWYPFFKIYEKQLIAKEQAAEA